MRQLPAASEGPTPNSIGGPGGPDLDRLPRTPITELRRLWVEHIGARTPPPRQRRVLIRELAWRIQERRYGGLDAETAHRLSRSDWAFMIPIVEMAKRPVWIREPLYLYEPSGLGKGTDRIDREQQIAAVVAKSPRRPQTTASNATVLDPQHLSAHVWQPDGGVLFLRHGERPSFVGLNAAQKDAVRLTDQGRIAALRLGKALGSEVLVAASPVLRAAETAAAIAEAMGMDESEVRQTDALVNFRIADTDTYESVKRRMGWAGLMTAWMDGSLDTGILIPCHDVAKSAIDAALTAAEAAGRSRVVAVTHDFMIMALLASLRGVRVTAVPYLGGVFVSLDEAQIMRKMEAIQ